MPVMAGDGFSWVIVGIRCLLREPPRRLRAVTPAQAAGVTMAAPRADNATRKQPFAPHAPRRGAGSEGDRGLKPQTSKTYITASRHNLRQRRHYNIRPAMGLELWNDRRQHVARYRRLDRIARLAVQRRDGRLAHTRQD